MHSKREKLPFGWGQAPGILTTFPPEDSLGLFVCDRGYVQGEKTTEIVFVAICLRLTHFVHKMPVLLSLHSVTRSTLVVITAGINVTLSVFGCC